MERNLGVVMVEDSIVVMENEETWCGDPYLINNNMLCIEILFFLFQYFSFVFIVTSLSCHCWKFTHYWKLLGSWGSCL